MANQIPSSHQQNETDIAVLQVQHHNLGEKVDDLKADLKNLRVHLDSATKSTHDLIRKFQDDNVAAHDEMADKLNALEKWKWIITGAASLAGALGFPVIEKLLGVSI